jgi:muconolactone D-isomerase
MGMEFLVQIEIVGSIGSDEASERILREQERIRAAELASAGILLRLWRIPGQRANWGIWNAKGASELNEALASLPLFPYMKIAIHPLAAHPNDPALPVNHCP